MITDEDHKPQKKNIRNRWLYLLFLLAIMASLFLLDGRGLLEQAGARMGLMPDALVSNMIGDIEYNYYYHDVFETEKYQHLRDELTEKPVKTYKDFENYVQGLSKLAEDEHTYFNYDSLSDMSTEYTDTNASDYIDDFSSFNEDGIPIIRFKQFAYETGGRVVEALRKIHESGGSVVVLDLTDNPGGMIDQCVQVCDALLPNVIIFEEQYNDLSRYQYVSDPQMIAFDKIVILLNHESASCSEILALTLKEHLKDNVVLIGTETYGKKVTQSVSQDDRLNFSLFLVTAKWSVAGKTTEDLNSYLTPWRNTDLNGFEDSFEEARKLIQKEGLIR